MNFSEIPVEYFERGIIFSKMSDKKPLIESFMLKNEIITVAFIKGVPIPYYSLAFFLSKLKLSPDAKFTWYNASSIEVFKEIQIKVMWRKLLLPDLTVSKIFFTLEIMINDHLKLSKEVADNHKAYVNFIETIEREYSSSLDNFEIII